MWVNISVMLKCINKMANFNVGIENSWSLVAFAKAHGKMKVTPELTNGETGEVFKTCAFVDDANNVTLVGFSSNLDSIDTSKNEKIVAKQIAAQKDDLQVVLLKSGNYKLCKRGEDNWAEVDLGI